jgi:hypothetical protein
MSIKSWFEWPLKAHRMEPPVAGGNQDIWIKTKALERIEVFRCKFLMQNAGIIYGYARVLSDASIRE